MQELEDNGAYTQDNQLTQTVTLLMRDTNDEFDQILAVFNSSSGIRTMALLEKADLLQSF